MALYYGLLKNDGEGEDKFFNTLLVLLSNLRYPPLYPKVPTYLNRYQ